MPKRFLRLDLSRDARDFEAVALEPGLPLLDKSNTTYRVLQKWLGRLAAEPEWHGKSVELFVCDDRGGRLHEVKCEPASSDDLQRVRELNQDLEDIEERLKQVKPESESETRILEVVRRHFRKLATQSSPSHKECHFFKYRDGGSWRLVWGWGYQRKDLAPAPPTICTNPNCSLLFVRHGEGSRNCPACEGKTPGPAAARKSRKSWLWVAALVIVAAATGYVVHSVWDKVFPPGKPPVEPVEQLTAVPEDWSGPVGSRIDFVVKYTDSDGKQEDASTRVVAVVEHPKVARLDRVGTTALARTPGKTAVHFYFRNLTAQSTLQAEPPSNPAKVVIEPAQVTLGIGSTAQLRVFGEFNKGEKVEKVDLTEAAEWLPVEGGNVYNYRGLLEGLAEGESTIVARYRATADEPYLQAGAKVNVADEQYKSLELALEPSSLIEGKAAGLEAKATTDSGETRSVLNSSKLKLAVDPPHVATVDGEYLFATRAGRANLKATCQGLSASLEFEVEHDPTPARFVVKPRGLRLIVGEVAELDVVTSSPDPTHVVSSAPGIVEVLDGHRVVGRAVGTATVTVSQEARREQVEVEVTRAEIRSITFVPSRPKVQVDDLITLRLVGRHGDDQEADLAADQIVWERLPSPTVVDLDVKNLQLRGLQPTGASPQSLTARYGDARATALVEVVAPPLRVEITPRGPIKLPVGQVVQLRAWANYRNDRRIELSPERVQWHSDPVDVSGLELDPLLGVVRAKKPGVGPVSVFAEYQGSRSNQVRLDTVDAAPLWLVLKADRALILVGDSGQLQASPADGTTPSDLALEAVRFQSSDPKLLAVDPRTGAYRATAPGDVTVTAKHPAAKDPAELKLQILEPDNVSLVFRPAEVKLRPGNRCELELYLVGAGREQGVSTVGDASGVRMAIGRPEAVSWKPPMLIGLSPAEPFEVSAAYRGKTARATVEVLPVPEKGQEPAIRVVPATALLTPGQSLAPRVEQQLPAVDDPWQEVEPSKVTWNVPPAVIWTPATADLRPQLTVPDSAKGPLVVEAEYQGKKATLQIQIGDKTPSGPLVVVREPQGEELPAGSQQRYCLMVESGARQEPAVDVRWQPPFENDYVRWDPPVLSAKKQGHQQRLSASAGDRETSFTTRIVGPAPEPSDDVPPPSGKPTAVRIVTGQRQPITIPVGARFDEFRVEAVFDQGPPNDVTREAALSVESDESSPAPVAVFDGRISAERPGRAVVSAEYNGVKSSDGLSVEVVDDLVLTAIELVPAAVELRVGETADLQANGFTGGGNERRSVGDVTSWATLQWKSENPEIVRTDGPTLAGLSPGSCQVAVTSGNVTAGAQVSVKDAKEETGFSEELELSPRSLRLEVGETKWIGSDVTLKRGEVDFSRQLEATSSAPSVVRYNRDNRSLEGVSPGKAEIAITLDDRRFALPVEVEPAEVGQEPGSVAIEPAGGTLAVGEGQELRVFLIGERGKRTDQTGSSMLASSDPAILAVSGNRVSGVSAGTAEVTARLGGSDESATATFTVGEEEFTGLVVIPPELKLAVGDEKSIRIVGVGPKGRRELSDHPDLKINVAGDRPDAVELRGASSVRGAAAGRATIDVSWQDLPARQVAVEVTDRPLAELRIEPPDTTIEVGQRAPFVVFAKRGRYEKALSVDDGVEVRIDDPSVAELGDEFTVRGASPGTTQLTAEIGSQRAVARLQVTSGGPVPPSDLPVGLQFVPDVLTLQLGVPGASVRVVKVSADGRQEDVDHRAEIKMEQPSDIVDVEWTASGPVFVPKKEGQTRAIATTEDNLTTRHPLLIQVVDPSKEKQNAHLNVSPNPLYLTAGETARLRNVQIVPGVGRTPINVDYRIESNAPRIVAVEDGKTLRGVAVGQTRVVVSPVNAGEVFQDLSAAVTVQVDAAELDPAREARLVLTGPARTTVGAEVAYRAELVRGESGKDVTHDATTLVLERGQVDLADVRAGCVLAAKRAGITTVRARHGELISNPLPLRIDPLATTFDRLELEIERRPLAVGEARPYQVWGYPPGGGARQDLTGRVTVDRDSQEGVRVLAFEPGRAQDDTPLVAHNPPTIVGKRPGRFKLAAARGPELRSEVIDLEVIQADPEIVDLKAEPSPITVRVGERTPHLRVTARQRTDHAPRTVEAPLESENEAILAPDGQTPGLFVGKALGQTRIKATFGGREAFADVSIVPNPLQQAALDPRPDFVGGGLFLVFVDVEGLVDPQTELEYRVVTVGNPDQGPWKTPARDGHRVKVRLKSPEMRQGPVGTVYHLRIQARDKRTQKVTAQYPVDFELDPGTVRRQSNSNSGE